MSFLLLTPAANSSRKTCN